LAARGIAKLLVSLLVFSGCFFAKYMKFLSLFERMVSGGPNALPSWHDQQNSIFALHAWAAKPGHQYMVVSVWYL
jgi:hypothetical protein